MSVSLLASIIPEFLVNGVPATGAQLFTYAAGTTTKLATYTDSTGLVAQTNPIVLNARGEPQNTIGNSVGLWLTNSTAYKFVLAPATDSDPPTSPIWTIDNITAGQLTGNAYTASGTNAILLSPTSGTPTPTAYTNQNIYVFTAPATTTGPVTLEVGSLGYLPAYISGTQAGSGQIQAGETVIAVYNSLLNSGAGGFALYVSVAQSTVLSGTDTGAVNAYAIAPSPVISAYTAGLIVSFAPANTNTGASTLNVNSLGVKSLTTAAGAALVAGQLVAGSEVIAIYDGTKFQVVNPVQLAASNLYATDTGAANAYVVTPTLPLPALTAGSIIAFKAANASTGASTINVSGLGVVSLVRTDGSAIQTGDIIAAGIYEAIYDGSKWQLLNPTPSVVDVRAKGSCTVSGGVLTQTFATNMTISRTGTGVVNVALSPNLPSSNYAVSVEGIASGGGVTTLHGVTNKTGAGFQIAFVNTSGVATDPYGCDISVSF